VRFTGAFRRKARYRLRYRVPNLLPRGVPRFRWTMRFMLAMNLQRTSRILEKRPSGAYYILFDAKKSRGTSKLKTLFPNGFEFSLQR